MLPPPDTAPSSMVSPQVPPHRCLSTHLCVLFANWKWDSKLWLYTFKKSRERKWAFPYYRQIGEGDKILTQRKGGRGHKRARARQQGTPRAPPNRQMGPWDRRYIKAQHCHLVAIFSIAPEGPSCIFTAAGTGTRLLAPVASNEVQCQTLSISWRFYILGHVPKC